jgi:hypothetical protein
VPVNLLQWNGNLFLVATRGQTQWARNARSSGKVTLTRGSLRLEFSLRVVPDREKPAILKIYLSRFNWMAWQLFPVPVDSPLAAFKGIASRYPVFELSETSSQASSSASPQ